MHQVEIAEPTQSMITFTRTTADHILQLRHQVLRPGLPIAEVIFAEDQDQKTRHYGALNHQREVICCVTLIPSTWHGEAAWRLRAMATAPDWRNQGIGTGLIRHLLEDLRESDQVRPIWSNARVSSARFYRELGWWEVSEQFENGNAGLSVKMLREEKTLAVWQVPGAGVVSKISLRGCESGHPRNEQEFSKPQIGNVAIPKPCFCSAPCLYLGMLHYRNSGGWVRGW